MAVVRLVPVLLALAVCLALPGSAAASPRQLTIMQDDQVFMGWSNHDPERAMAEARTLGADVIRTTLVWEYVAPHPRRNRKPAGHDIADPNSPGYRWGPYDRVIGLARKYGLKVLVNVTGSIPHWASAQPRRCRRRCVWKPRPSLFGRFVQAVARRYRGQVSMYSIWNEYNLGAWLLPQTRRSRFGPVDVAGRAYRQLWLAGWRGIRRRDPPRRNKVLFGETAAIAEPIPSLLAALCLDPLGRPFRGGLRQLQGCRHPKKLPIAGFAHHPYNRSATGSWRTRTRIRTSLSLGYLWRLSRLSRLAARRHRIPRRRGVWVTEFGYQSRPPDRVHGLRLGHHARVLNESERLFFADPHVRAFSQYEVFDAAAVRQYNTGLRLKGGRHKPAYDAFRLAMVVTRLSRNRVEVWGCARAGRGPRRVSIFARRRGRKKATSVARPLTNSRGYFRIRIRRRNASRLLWRAYRTRVDGYGNITGRYGGRLTKAGRRVHYSFR
jgi:hypothetical protein